MKLIGRIIAGTKILKEVKYEANDEELSYRDKLETGLIALCKELDISVPLWLKKNTTEFVNYHRTSFSNEQFVENVTFDRFEIRAE